MSVEILNSIGQLFITILGCAGGIATIFYIAKWVVNFALSLIFPGRYNL